ncbi:ABC-three component system protein [Vagococcus salmoninarum]|uniref:ABC-three component systems C-terminal domain-containing protein n=1 Tax=Vagococcus salmoninarum TaxID=2739 RepID=A0A429ZU50_9ENTE|nr:ABC-three component system protein [Vagococcus salmoninarum]RST97172.1 hypothetical protein CBF35_02670 [Vagococcus salmoninarum]
MGNIKKVDIEEPEIPLIYDLNMGIPVTPIDRISLMSPDDFEKFVSEWAYGYLKPIYSMVKLYGGAGDKGRDVVGYLKNGKIDIYQCKHYDNKLTPTQYWTELGKLCVYTYEKHYGVPENYYIVTSKGIGTKLSDLINDPKGLKRQLISNWKKHCETKINSDKVHILEGELLKHVEKFDFSIIKEVSINTIIDQHSQTIYFKFRFGGGIKKRPRLIMEDPHVDEENNNYVVELFEVYSQDLSKKIETISELKKHKKYYNHFVRQREAFFSVTALKRFIRDEYIGDNVFMDFRTSIYKGIIDVLETDHISNYAKVNQVLQIARSIQIDSRNLPDIFVDDRSGACHDLVNDEKVSWLD